MKNLIILFISIFLIPSLIFAQTEQEIEKATRETQRLGRPEEIEEKLKKTPEKPTQDLIKKEAPAKRKEEKFFVKKIILVGCESFPPEKFSPMINKYENKEVSMSELDILSKEIEAQYLRLGIIAAVFPPPQETESDTVKLQVIEARMGELKIERYKHFKNKRLNYYWRIKPGAILRYDQLAKGIQMMNKNPDREVRASLRAGKKVGTTDVILTPKIRFPAHLTLSFDREGAPITGNSRKGIGMRHNNFLGIDDIFLVGYNYGKEFWGKYIYQSLPINSNGASLFYGYSRSHSSPKEEFTSSVLRSNVKTSSISLHQDLYQKSEYLGEVSLGVKANDKTVSQKTGVYNRDRLRIFSLATTLLQRGLGTNTSYSIELSQGLDAFGATAKDNPLASRSAKPVFTKLIFWLQHKKILPLNLRANLKLTTQVASVKLTPQEEFNLGGIDSVRGYPSGDFQADNAVVTNAELLIPAFFIPGGWRLPYAEESLREQTTLLAFFDYGWGMRKSALQSEHGNIDMVGLGPGLRIRLFKQAYLRLEWGFAVGNHAITQGGNTYFHFSVDFQDNLPEEIERIKKVKKKT